MSTHFDAEYRVNDDYTLDIASRFGAATPSVTFTVGTNCNVVKYALEDRRLSTEIWNLGASGEGIAKPFSVECDDDAIQAYGARPWLFTPRADTESERNQEISDQLDKRKSPGKVCHSR